MINLKCFYMAAIAFTFERVSRGYLAHLNRSPVEVDTAVLRRLRITVKKLAGRAKIVRPGDLCTCRYTKKTPDRAISEQKNA